MARVRVQILPHGDGIDLPRTGRLDRRRRRRAQRGRISRPPAAAAAARTSRPAARQLLSERRDDGGRDRRSASAGAADAAAPDHDWNRHQRSRLAAAGRRLRTQPRGVGGGPAQAHGADRARSCRGGPSCGRRSGFIPAPRATTSGRSACCPRWQSSCASAPPETSGEMPPLPLRRTTPRWPWSTSLRSRLRPLPRRRSASRSRAAPRSPGREKLTPRAARPSPARRCPRRGRGSSCRPARR